VATTLVTGSLNVTVICVKAVTVPGAGWTIWSVGVLAVATAAVVASTNMVLRRLKSMILTGN